VTGTRSSFGAAGEAEAPQTAPAERQMMDPSLFDPSKPNIARIYDYWLGGKDNYPADRAEAERLIAVYPRLPMLARQNRLFLGRAVRWLAEQGVRQFLDLGCGLPTVENTHEIVQAVHPDCRVVYVDADPVVLSHARALLRGPGVTAIHGDLAKPSDILAELRARHLINLAEPTVVILTMVLHFFDAATAHDIVATFARAVTPGSYFVLSVGSGDEQTGDALAREYQAGTLYNHSLAQIAAFIEDLEPIPPGVTDAVAWVPGSLGQPPPAQTGGHILAGVARKPEARTRPFPCV
jgi:O-methyltransferase involved in polyketide biosynthesis